MRYASICAIVKDEDASLREWLVYHLAIGFEHATIYDNGSATPVNALLREFVDAGLVTAVDFPLRENQQLSAYFHCLREQRPHTRWLAFIDVDEFIVPLKNTDIRDFLDNYADYGGVGVHWKMFGSSGHLQRPDGNVIENYTETLGLNEHIKSIVQTKYATHPLSPHHFAYKDNYYCVNEDKFIIDAPFSYPIGNIVTLNHYYYKSQQDYEEKINRGLATQIAKNVQRSIDTFYDHITQPGNNDTSILEFAEMLALYNKLSPLQIAGIIHAECNINAPRELEKVMQALNNKNIIDASAILTRLKRYHSNFEIMLLDAVIAFLNGNKDDGMKALNHLFVSNKASPDHIYKIYNDLKIAYLHSSNANALVALEDFIKKHSCS